MSKLFLDEEKIGRLLKLSNSNPRDFAIFHIALASGFRAGDLLFLKRVDVERTNGGITTMLRIKMRKTGKIIERELPDACRKAVQEYLKSRTDSNPFLFYNQSNVGRKQMDPMNRSSLHRIYKKFLTELLPNTDLRGAACHTTRRSIAMLISTKAGRIEPATRFLGHSSIASTIAYLDMDKFGQQANGIVKSLPWNQNS